MLQEIYYIALSASNTNDLRSLFSEGLFRIPNFQRRYSWEDKQIKDLFNDLWEGFQTSSYHYLGPISLLKHKKNIGIHSVYAIIDGQQRFTSLLILYSVIANYLKDNDLLSFIIKQINNESVYFLEAHNDTDKKHLASILNNKLGEAKTKSQKLMKGAYKYFLSEIKKLKIKTSFINLPITYLITPNF